MRSQSICREPHKSLFLAGVILSASSGPLCQQTVTLGSRRGFYLKRTRLLARALLEQHKAYSTLYHNELNQQSPEMSSRCLAVLANDRPNIKGCQIDAKFSIKPGRLQMRRHTYSVIRFSYMTCGNWKLC